MLMQVCKNRSLVFGCRRYFALECVMLPIATALNLYYKGFVQLPPDSNVLTDNGYILTDNGNVLTA